MRADQTHEPQDQMPRDGVTVQPTPAAEVTVLPVEQFDRLVGSLDEPAMAPALARAMAGQEVHACLTRPGTAVQAAMR